MNEFIGKHVLVRASGAGVLIGVLRWMAESGGMLLLESPQRIWRWTPGETSNRGQECVELAVYGCGEDSRITRHGTATLVRQVLEVHLTSPEARETFSPRWPE